MMSPNWLRLLLLGLAGAICAAEYARLRPNRPVVLARATERVQAAAAPEDGLESSFVRHMTPDDVARGVWGLAEAGTLTPEQRVALAPLLERGTEQRMKLGALRTRRRAQIDALLADHAALLEAVGPERARGAAR